MQSISRKIPNDVLAALSRGYMENGAFKMPEIDHDIYPKVKKALNGLGIEWVRKIGGHVCPSGDDPMERIEDALQTRSYEKPNRLEFFETPKSLVEVLIEMADIEPEMMVLEPSAGKGAIAQAITDAGGDVICIEIDPVRSLHLKTSGYKVQCDDFLKIDDYPTFDRVVMNPPFRNQQDIDHVMHAWRFLRPGGRLVAVMSAGTTFRQTKKAATFRELLDSTGFWRVIDEGAFKSSGTMVSTILVVMNKPEAAR